MKIKKEVSPAFGQLKEFIDGIPDNFETCGETLHKGRNTIKVFEVDGVRVNVKRFRKPLYIFNRVVYSYFRDPKAVRAYNYALKLKDLGYNTPTPIAYILECDNNMVGYSYFISIQVDYEFFCGEFGYDVVTPERELALSAIGRYTAALHKSGIVHNDYGSGNLLYNIADGAVDFCLVDINRMYFGKVSKSRGCSNFERFVMSDNEFSIVARAYAEAMKYDETDVYSRIIAARKHYTNKFTRRIKRYLRSSKRKNRG